MVEKNRRPQYFEDLPDSHLYDLDNDETNLEITEISSEETWPSDEEIWQMVYGDSKTPESTSTEPSSVSCQPPPPQEIKTKQKKLDLDLEPKPIQPQRTVILNPEKIAKKEITRPLEADEYFNPTIKVDLLSTMIDQDSGITLKKVPELLENQLSRYQAEHNLRPEDIKKSKMWLQSTISKNLHTLPLVMHLIGFNPGSALSNQDNPSLVTDWTEDQRQRLLLGTAKHQIFEVIQTSMGYLTKEQPFTETQPSSTHSQRMHISKAIERAMEQHNGEITSVKNGTQFFEDIWYSYVYNKYQNQDIDEVVQMSLQPDHVDFKNEVKKICEYLFKTYVGHESLIPESSPDFDKRFEQKQLLIDSKNRATVSIRQDCVWRWMPQSLQKDGSLLDLGFSDLKNSRYFYLENKYTHPLQKIAFAVNTLQMLHSDYLMYSQMQAYKDSDSNHQLPIPKLFYNKKAIAKRHSLCARYLHIDSEDGTFQPYEIQARKGEMEWYHTMWQLLIEAWRSTTTVERKTSVHQQKNLRLFDDF